MDTEIVSRDCPYCGESIELVVDCSVPQQTYIEDCFVCCRPITVTVDCGAVGELLSVRLSHENEA